jgi:hypothetical protein
MHIYYGSESLGPEFEWNVDLSYLYQPFPQKKSGGSALFYKVHEDNLMEAIVYIWEAIN